MSSHGQLYKVLGDDGAACHGGTGRWHLPRGDKPGRWRSVRGPLVPCKNGIHLCRIEHLLRWLGPTLYVAEHDGELVEAGEKVVVRRARLLRPIDAWNEQTARSFAADCAERVLTNFESRHPDDDRPRRAIEVARRFAHGEASEAELSAAARAARAAESAAWAAESAARAAELAAWAAASAARAASAVAAESAAESAAWAAVAAESAAWTAERRWQSQHLAEILGLPWGATEATS